MSRLRNTLLTIGAIAGTLCLVVALASVVLGVKPLVFRSGSMSPTIPTGALGLSRPAAATDVHVGDVVSVMAGNGTRITHRVTAVTGSGTSRDLSLQGDANPVPDAESYHVVRVDRVFWSVPYVGYVVAFLGGPVGRVLLGGYVLAMLLVLFRGDRPTGGRRNRQERPKGGKRRASAAVSATVAAGVVVAATTGTAAAFRDTSAVTSSSLTARTLARPGVTTCNVTGTLSFTATITWSVQTSPTTITYTAKLREGGTLTVTTAGGTAQVQVTSGLLGSLFGTTVHVDITAVLPGTTWTTGVRTRALAVGPAGLSLTCGADS